MKQVKTKLLSILLAVVMMLGLMPAQVAYAAGSLQNVSISSDGILTWDAFSDPDPSSYGSVQYSIRVGTISDMTSSTSFNVEEKCNSFGFANGKYEVTLVAMKDTTAISEKWYGSYTYTAKAKLDTPTGLSWSGSVASWNPVEHAQTYNLNIYRDGSFVTSRSAGGNTSYDIADLVVEGAHVYKFEVYALAEGYQSSDEATSAEMLINTTPTPTLNVTVTNDGNGVGTATPAYGVSGTEIELKASPNSGFIFKEWQVISGDVSLADASSATTTFELGTQNVEVKAIFEAKPTVTITAVASPSDGGKVQIEGETWGATSTKTVTTDYALPLYLDARDPADGYKFVRWEKDGDIVSVSPYFAISDYSSNATYTAVFQRMEYKASLADISFGTATTGYSFSASDNRLITLTNTGTEDLPNNIECFTISGPNADSFVYQFMGSGVIPAGDSSNLGWIRPKNGLSVGSYSATVTYTDSSSGTTASGTVTFIVAELSADIYTVTISDDGNGTASASLTSGITGTEVTLTSTPNSGYQFKEWQVVSGGVTITDNKFTIGTENVEVKAVFEAIPTYTVTFDANGHGTAPATQTVNSGEKATEPTAPTETGWTFGGWYQEAACTTAFDFSTAITGNITLYAKWTEESTTPVTYTVTFDANGHGTAPAAQTVNSGEKAIEPTAPTESGWTFGGWYQDATCSVAFDFSTVITADITLYAKWTEESVTPPVPTTYTVTFDANGHGTAPAAQTVNSGEKATEPTAPTETGWTFGGWYQDATCSVAFDFSTAITADITLYAKWTEESVTPPVPTTYTVTFDANGHGTAPAAQTVNSGEKATEPTAPTETGWTFGGWYQDATCSVAFDFSTAITADITLYAKWTEESVTPPLSTTYAFTKGDGAVWQKGSVEGLEFTVKGSPDDTDTFANFVGIQTDGAAVATGHFNAAAGSVELILKADYLETLAVGAHTLKAAFKDGGSAEAKFTVKDAEIQPETCTITFDPNGGTGAMAPVTVNVGEKYTLPENGFTAPEGKAFDGWDKGQPGEQIDVTGDTVITAQWKDSEEPGTTPEEPGYTFKFSFTKLWQGDNGDSIDWVLYNPDGTVAHKKFNKKIVSENEWHYEAWFASGADYYLIETVPAGYKVRYENVGAHAGDTTRCYNGGTIINYKVPKTGDRADLQLWLGCVLLGVSAVCGTLVFSRRKKENR